MSGRILMNRTQMRLIVLGAAALALSACSSSGSDSAASTTLSVTGTLTQTAASDLGNPVSMFEANFATAGTKVSLDCGASGVFSATVDPTTGAFSATGIPTGVPCSFNFVSSTNGATKCQVSFQDSSNYDLNNNPMSTATATASSSVALGSITCDTSGNISIPSSGVSGISSAASVESSTAFDFTGVWTIGAYDGTLPTGYATAESNCGSNCHGPSTGEIISLVRFHGNKFTPSSGQCTPAINVTCPASSGTVDTTKDGYGMSIWGGDYAHGIGACGANTGFTADEARAYARISLDTTAPSLSGNQLNYAHYSWSTPTGFGTDTGWTKPWMYGGATSSYNLMDCQPVSVPSTSGGSNKAGFACFSQVRNVSGGTGVYVWNVGLANAGGCVDSNNAPIMVNNWANISNGTCSSTASGFNSNFNTNACTYTGAPVSGQASTTFTCSFTGGAFNDISTLTGAGNNNGPNFSSAYTFVGGTWPGQPATVIAAGATCANAGTTEAAMIVTAGGAAGAAQAKAAKELLMRYQCYANQYWQHTSNGAGSTSCSRNYNFNWATNNYANFVMGDDRSMKPQNAYITDRVFYSADGQWAFVKNEDTKYQSIPTSSGSTLCPMKSITELKFKRLTNSKILVNFIQSTVMADKSATCQAAVAAALTGGGTVSPDPTGMNNLYRDLQTQRMLFYLSK